MSDDRLKEIEEREKAATPGPWVVSPSFGYYGNTLSVAPAVPHTNDGNQRRDRDFIAHAREDVPWLIARVKELERLVTVGSQAEEAMVEIARRYENERDALVARVRELEQWVNDLQSGLFINCVYCGHRYGPGEAEIPQQALESHIASCPAHPLSRALARVRELEAENNQGVFLCETLSASSIAAQKEASALREWQKRAVPHLLDVVKYIPVDQRADAEVGQLLAEVKP